MKTRTFVSISILVLAVMFIAGSCVTDKMTYISKEYEIYGIWVNPDYADAGTHGKLVLHPTGEWETYYKLTDTKFAEQGVFVITNKWIDSKGNIWYTIKSKGIGGLWYHHLNKISDFGKTLEDTWTLDDYPPEIIRDNPKYHYEIRYRQE